MLLSIYSIQLNKFYPELKKGIKFTYEMKQKYNITLKESEKCGGLIQYIKGEFFYNGLSFVLEIDKEDLHIFDILVEVDY